MLTSRAAARRTPGTGRTPGSASVHRHHLRAAGGVRGHRGLGRRAAGGAAAGGSARERHGTLLERCEHLSADKGYDDGKLIERLWHQIKPVIDIRKRRDQQGGLRTAERDLHLRRRGVVCLSEDRRRAQHGLRRLRTRSQHLEVPLSGARVGIECKGMEQCPVGAAVLPARIGAPHAPATPGRHSWSGSTAAWLARSGSTTRSSVGWPRCGCAARWRCRSCWPWRCIEAGQAEHSLTKSA